MKRSPKAIANKGIDNFVEQMRVSKIPFGKSFLGKRSHNHRQM
ncbi:hypothetical protein [Nostoc sp. UHCC 0252]|nr:hypothetical protein [Nostoc sp. UHCC 0252]MEA5600594.1 hypothetical protein [Nostoc sp. UHCC 0252]